MRNFCCVALSIQCCLSCTSGADTWVCPYGNCTLCEKYIIAHFGFGYQWFSSLELRRCAILLHNCHQPPLKGKWQTIAGICHPLIAAIFVPECRGVTHFYMAFRGYSFVVEEVVRSGNLWISFLRVWRLLFWHDNSIRKGSGAAGSLAWKMRCICLCWAACRFISFLCCKFDWILTE